jgi:hypothetical protein
MSIPPLPPHARPPAAPLTSTEGLKLGDVVQIAVQLRDDYGKLFWWKRFAVVVTLPKRSGDHFYALNLKLHPTQDDVREVDFDTDGGRPQVVTKLEEPWPQGVAAMHMKLVAQGVIKIGED